MAELLKYKCTCGSMKFRMLSLKELIVNFELEGGVSGHPMLTIGSEQFLGFRCVKCGKPVPQNEAEVMRKEVL